jgi:16S rRNA (guanine527-N7)-methyltransferase
MFRNFLQAEFQPWGVLSDDQLDRLERHYKLLMSWNHRLNLTRITDLSEVVRFHYCESLFISNLLPDGHLSVCDLGSGAGFPGFPLAVMRPELEVTLIESDQRKAVFLREASRGIENIEVLAGRHQECKRTFGWIVSRAVALDEVLESTLAPNSALLLSAANAPPRTEVTKLPWGRDRIVAVSRGT